MRIATLAEQQHGIVARWQLEALGVRAGAIQRRIEGARLHRVFRGAFAVGHPLLSERGRWMAAVLASGPAAALSHRSGGALWDVAPYAGIRIEVTVSGSRRAGPAAIVVHGGRLGESDVEVRDGIPVTSLARTLFDLAEVVDPTRLRRAFERAERLGLLDLAAIAEVAARSPGRRALKPIRALLAELTPAPATRSELERRFLELCEGAGLPAPAVNVAVAGFEVDTLWVPERVIVELDGFEFHRSRDAFERDRARDSALQAAGYRVLRVTFRRISREPEAIIAELRRLLGVRARGSQPQ